MFAASNSWNRSFPAWPVSVTTPVFDQDGNLVSQPGYHPEAMLWFHRLDGIDIAAAPEHPSAEEVQAARRVNAEGERILERASREMAGFLMQRIINEMAPEQPVLRVTRARTKRANR